MEDPSIIEFGPFSLDERERILRKHGQPVPLTPRAVDVLLALVERPGRLMIKEELVQRVWPDTFVEESNLAYNIFTLRKALGDTAENPEYVETIPRRGYRFKAPVRRLNGVQGSSVGETGGPDQGSRSPAILPVPEQPMPRFEGPAGFAVRERGRLGPRKIGLLLALAFAGLAATATFVYLSQVDTTNPLLRALPLTSLPGREFSPAVSPDGSRVAFLWDGGERRISLDLYVQGIDGGGTLKLATGPVRQPAWSPDGTRIAFLRYTEGTGEPRRQEVLEVPATGGTERRLALAGGQQFGLAWAPDGSSFAIVDKPATGAPDAIYLMSTHDGHKHQLTSPPAGYVGDCFPRFSPDGGRLAFVRVRYWDSADVYVMDLRGGALTRVTREEEHVLGAPDWLQDRNSSLIYSSAQRQLSGLSHLWKTAPDGRHRELLGDGFEPSLSRGDHPLLAYVRIEIDTNVWRLPGPRSPDGIAPGRVIESTQVDASPQYSPDGRRIAFLSNRSGTRELWLSDSDGSNAARLTFLETNSIGRAAWSLDGQFLAFSASVTGNVDVYLISAKGGFPKRLTSAVGDELFPSFSRDRKWIYFSSRRSGSDQVWRIPRDGGAWIQMTREGAIDAGESPDGRFLYFTKALYAVGRPGIWRQPLAGGPEEKIADDGQAMQWALVDAGPCYVKGPRSDKASVECLDATSRSVTWVTPLEGPAHLWGALSVSPDGNWVLLDRWDKHENDLMMVKDFNK